MHRVSLLIFLPAALSIIVTDPPPTSDEYKYSHSIDDPTTGDAKSQHESKYGDTVTGSYSVVDLDGTRRIVEYRADPRTGFNAVVKLEPPVTKIPKYFLKNPAVLGRRYTTIPAAFVQNTPEVYFTAENEPYQNVVTRRHYFIPVNKYYNL